MSSLLPTHSPNLFPAIIWPDNGEPVKGAELPSLVGGAQVQGEAQEVKPDIAHLGANLGMSLIKVKEQVEMFYYLDHMCAECSILHRTGELIVLKFSFGLR